MYHQPPGEVKEEVPTGGACRGVDSTTPSRYASAMFDRFTERARKVMTLAWQEAERLRNDYIGTEHLILGLLLEGSGIAARVLKNLGMDLFRVRAEVELLVEHGTTPIGGGQLPFTPRAKRVLELALEEAQTLGHNYIGTEHLLLGLVRESDGPAAHVLQNLGVTREAVRAGVVELLGSDPSPVLGGPGAPVPPEREEARARVEAILLERARSEAQALFANGGARLDVRMSRGPKGWGFQLWMARLLPGGMPTIELALWVAEPTTLEEHFPAILAVFVRLVGSEEQATGPGGDSIKK